MTWSCWQQRHRENPHQFSCTDHALHCTCSTDTPQCTSITGWSTESNN